MRTMSLRARAPARDWQLVIAAGFIALTLFGAAVDRRNAFVDSSAVGSAEHAAVPPTTPELAQEMIAHD